ncbi:RE1-silencing transcription factor-like, partial [Peromyscus leucopus]|uniref:RE1-silencing transcription factor-like n=1 Tax=Peromyscus leucopus TaxID=10041 RepID=UPI0010A1C3CA
VSKEKKSCGNASVVQVTTRSRKSVTETKAAETKHIDVHTGNNKEKVSKAKKNKRKVDAEAHPSDEPVNEEPVTEKKKKMESKSKNSTEVPKDDSKTEETKGDNKKQNTSIKKGAKKKPQKGKSSKKVSRPARETQKETAPAEPPSMELAQEEVSSGPVLTQVVVTPTGSTQPGLPSPMDIAQTGPAQMELPSPLMPPQREPPPPLEPAQRELPSPLELPQREPPPPTEHPPPMEPDQMEPPPPMEPAQRELPPPMEPDQMELPPPMESQWGHCQKRLLCPLDHAQVEVAQTGPPHMGSVQKEPPAIMEPPLQVKPVTKRSSSRKESTKEKLGMLSEVVRQEQVLIEVGLMPVRDSQLLKGSRHTQDLPKGNSRRDETPKDQEIGSDGEGNKMAPIKKVGTEEAGKSLAMLAAPKESTSVLSSEQNSNGSGGETLCAKCQTESAGLCEMEVDTEQNPDSVPVKASAPEPASPLPPVPSPTVTASSPITLAENESPDIDEDKGIHSHDGSDLSDNMSEGRDDSGLHGARPVPQESSSKSGKEGLAVKITEGELVCIFCDRSFRKEKDYSKHLNRHLVNVYFLEKAAEGQE